MPVVILRTKHGGKGGWFREDLAKALPEIIAPALDVEPSSIIISPFTHHPVHDYTANGKDFEIYILAHAFPERMKNLTERGDEIGRNVRQFLDQQERGAARTAKGFVWILPVDSVFVKI